MAIDFLIKDNGEGGFVDFLNGDFEKTQSVESAVYLCLFGGNYEKTTSEIKEGEFRQDWWANQNIYTSAENLQMNSFSEKFFKEKEITSDNIYLFKEEVEKDLEKIPYNSEVSVSLTNDSKISINIFIDNKNINITL